MSQPAGVLDELRLKFMVCEARIYALHKPYSSVSALPRHQPATTLVYITRWCKYSQVLLMMGKNIARNM